MSGLFERDGKSDRGSEARRKRSADHGTALYSNCRFRPFLVRRNGTFRQRLRLTILLDAVPMNPRSLKLRAWDRAFLLDSISSVLREIPSESVRIVAFNLDQQEEISRDDNFDRSGLARLSHALRKVELGSISYHKLSQPQGWSEMLTRLSKDELEAEEPADAVIFLGRQRAFPKKFLKKRSLCRKAKRLVFIIWNISRPGVEAMRCPMRSITSRTSAMGRC